MAIQAQMYPENLGLPLGGGGGGGGGGSQDWLMDINNNNPGNIINNSNSNNNNNNFVFHGGCGLNEFSFNLLQKQHQQQPQQQISYQQQQQQQLQQQYLVQFHNLHQRNQEHNQCFHSENGFAFLPSSKNNNTSTTSTISTTASSDHMSMNLSQSLAAQLEKQRQEIDRYITLQNERLKMALQQQRKQQLATIVRKLEARATALLKQKDEEITKARNRTMELEEGVRKMEVESQAWQRVAAEKEAIVISLNNTLQQLREQQACSANGVDDAESCCDDNDFNNENRAAGNNDDDDDGEEAQEQETGNSNSNKGLGLMMMTCRFCNCRKSCMLLLPCRHLCSCKACEPFIDACPLCRSPKTASIEALFS